MAEDGNEEIMFICKCSRPVARPHLQLEPHARLVFV